MSAPQAPLRAAAFVRVESLLLPDLALRAPWHAALNAPGVGGRAGRVAALTAGLPLLGALQRVDRRTARRLAAYACRGLGGDRLAVLWRERYADLLSSPLRPLGEEVVARARAGGHRLVLVSTAPEVALAPLAERLGADALLGARFELRDGVATGRLEEPLAPGRVEACADALGVSLAGSYAYGVDTHDLPLLRCVGFPCAVRPDVRLRRAAERAGWPMLWETAS